MNASAEPSFVEPSNDCPLCPRLRDFREEWRAKEPTWFNAPVPSFRSPQPARLIVVGLAPGLRGANRTGRPFTGDYAGDLLYKTLVAFGFATGKFEARINDSLELIQTIIVNAVRCVPPQNKPLPAEIHTCRQFLEPYITNAEDRRVIVTLGAIAHQSTVRALGLRIKDFPFKHGLAAALPGGGHFVSSYHCSRYNTNTGVLTEAMFQDVFRKARALVDA